jgi:tetraacyldisaccharide 4'-kinase
VAGGVRGRLIQAWQDGLPAPWDQLLVPASAAYRAGLALRQTAYAVGLRRSRRLPCRVVAVGNLTVGGTGKTPTVELLVRALVARGHRVVVLSRGYGRRAGPDVALVSDESRVLLGAADAGDEPVVLARRLPGVPVVVGADRHRAGEWVLERLGADVLVLDDGFQQRRLRTDVDVVCVDARAPWGQRGLLPRGSLREPPAALGRAHLLVVTHAGVPTDRASLEAELRRFAPSAPLVHAGYEMDGLEELGTGTTISPATLRSQTALAFAGIAGPERFAATLAGLGVALRELVAFPDHHVYEPRDLAELEARARRAGATLLLTTEKDAVRLPRATGLPVWVVRVRLRFDEGADCWWAVLHRRLAAS